VGSQADTGSRDDSLNLLQETGDNGRLMGVPGTAWVQLGSNAYRFLAFFSKNSVIVLTHGFSKKSQKTPRNEIERAEAYKKDSMRRSKS
jgi:phage-related protein